jgi:penicillin-binding protein 1B
VPIRIRIARKFWRGTFARAVLVTLLVLFVVGAAGFTYLWISFSHFIDSRLGGEIFERASHVYAAPELVAVGDSLTLADVIAELRRFGYSGPDEALSSYGSFQPVGNNGLEIRPGPDSRVGPDQAVRLRFDQGQVTRIQSLPDEQLRQDCWLDPELVTNLFDRRRTKRRLVRYQDLPPSLIQALLAAEDRRFFSHMGISVWDGFRALWIDIRKGAPVQGASTLTMQLARSFFLTPSRTVKRKAAEALIALQLERRFSKEKILELYSNEIYLGHRGSFSIHGFGEGAQAYFNKDISQLTLPESALLAGIIRGPNRYSPYRNPERALERRNYILDSMVETGALTAVQAEEAKQQPLTLAPANVEASEAPYFVDLVKDRLLSRYSEEELVSSSYRVYTTLDLRLQRAAAEAIAEALPEVDAKIEQRYRHRAQSHEPAQVALVVLDPHTGAVKALVGGRDYNTSQLNRVVAERQPGSSFKPFVYAAAFEASLEDPEHAITPITTVVDEPTVFEFDGQSYEPSNYGEKFYGIVTVRDALIHSLNVATVKVAQMTGYERVAELGVAAGFNPRLKPTPAISLGAYDSTPIEVSGAYTIFANGGDRVDPFLIASVLDRDDHVLQNHQVTPVPVLDPRVAYLVVDLLEDTINRGTGAGARARGFTVPAAGKTGTSRDAWFIGFTSNLLCVVWVGFDDGSDLGLPGSSAALPIWTAFMKRAVGMPAYKDTEEFIPPEGIVSVPLDPETLSVATPECPEVRMERFILGTEPHELCPRHRPSTGQRVTRTLLRAIGVGNDRQQEFVEEMRRRDRTTRPEGAASEEQENQAEPAGRSRAASNEQESDSTLKKIGRGAGTALKKAASVFGVGGKSKKEKPPPQPEEKKQEGADSTP